MQSSFSFIHRQQQLWLSPERCIFWEEQKALILSDLHFGKTGHFRKAGIPIPQHIYKEDLQRLVQLIQYFQPVNLIVVGDLFHSDDNKELDLFKKWRKDFEHLSIQLVKGNHDVLKDEWYREANLTLHAEYLNVSPFAFTHDITKSINPNREEQSYFFSGHIHPGISLKGAGKQSLRFSCFYFGKHFAVLPAFSKFTGTFLIEPKRSEPVFAIVENKIVQLQ